MKPFTPNSWRVYAMAVAVSALAGCAGTTYGTGKSPGVQTVEDIVGIVDFSAGKNKEPIDYKPRPDIVAPPSTAVLPPPVEPGTATAADWPRDPDELAKQRRAAAAAATDGLDTPMAATLYDPGFRLPAQEPRERRSDDPVFTDPTKEALMTQQERKQAKQIFATAKSGSAGRVDENGNPIRTTLTEPPSEYRIPDAEAPEVYTTEDGGKKKRDWWPLW